MKKLLTVAFVGWLFVWTANSADAAPPVPESVVWEEGIEYSNSDDTHLQLNLARPKSGDGPFPTVLVIHENRGLNPDIEDVARRAAAEGFLALAPDGLSPVGGYPGNDDDGRARQSGIDQGKLRTDMVNSARYLKTHALSSGKLGVTGFCWGGSTTNYLAATLGADVQAAIP